jgi:AcrR family transcriptional regulator
MSAAQTQSQADDTKQRLLSAAGAVFAERGFERATIREICRRAQANLAAAHYHFGDKQALYAEVLAYGAKQRVEAHPPDRGLDENAPPEEALRAFIHSFLCRFLARDEPAAWYATLCARELTAPTMALDRVVDEIIRPLHARLSDILRKLMGENASAEDVQRCTLSIVGQCLFYHHSRPVLERLFGPQQYGDADLRCLADHIASFSLAALRGLRQQRGRR